MDFGGSMDNKTVVITGANRGMGRVIVECFAREV